MFGRSFLTIGDSVPVHYEQQLKWNIEATGMNKNALIVAMCQGRKIMLKDAAGEEYEVVREAKEAIPLTPEQLEGLCLSKLLEEKDRSERPQPKSNFSIKPITKDVFFGKNVEGTI